MFTQRLRPLLASCLLLSFLSVALNPSVGRADEPATATFESQLLARAPQIYNDLNKKGFRNVGVLRFQVQVGDRPPSDSIGTMNLLMADRVELALIFKNHIDARQMIGVLHRVSEVAAEQNGANLLTAEGREKLFGIEYPMALGDEYPKPSAFITGKVVVKPDLREMTVTLQVVDRDGNSQELTPPITAPVDAQMLNELGISYSLAGDADEDDARRADAALARAAQVAAGKAAFPLNDPHAPLKLTVLYDGTPAPIDVNRGQATLREPDIGQQVTLRVTRNAADQRRYAFVLKVEGRSTLNREKQRDFDCQKWLLDQDSPGLDFTGYHTNRERFQPIRIGYRQGSNTGEVYFGVDPRQISLTVYGERKIEPKIIAADPATDEAKEELAYLNAIQRGLFFTPRPSSISALKFRYLASPGGCLVVDRSPIPSFNAHPVPLMSVNVGY